MSHVETTGKPGPARRDTPTIVWAAVAVVLLLAWFHPDILRLAQTAPHRIDVGHLQALMARWGPWAPVASVLLMIAHTFVPFPADLLFVANGALFGFWGGLAVSWIGAMASACLAFGMARALGRPVEARVVPRAMLAWVDGWIARGDWPVALALRFIPMVPFGLLNFALGLTALPWTTFLWTTGAGILPNCIAMVAAGYGAAGARQVLPWALAALLGLTVLGLVLRLRLVPPAMEDGEPVRSA